MESTGCGFRGEKGDWLLFSSRAPKTRPGGARDGEQLALAVHVCNVVTPFLSLSLSAGRVRIRMVQKKISKLAARKKGASKFNFQTRKAQAQRSATGRRRKPVALLALPADHR